MAKESGQQGNKAKLTASAHYFHIVLIGASAGEYINGGSV
ncbi:hypothetical protein LX77_03401 [Gelidibacter algens]|uniref:Uncharacterized protein n=1 Tax=Gelidibacter algens TaxID=49280 RepID=A0A327RTT4_9FLAO|nr:hypothetical protein LX77_03401 [Gelidibacter algens]